MYPSDFINPSLKSKKEYCLAYIKEMHSSLFSRERVDEWKLHRQYSNATQPNSIYQNYFNPLVDGVRPESYLNTNYKNLAIIPKFKNVVLNYLADQEYEIAMDAINPLSIEAKESQKIQTWAKMQLAQSLNEVSQETGVDVSIKEPLPINKEELEINALFGFRLPHELAMELGTAMVMEESEWKEILKSLREDMFATGHICPSVEIDVISGKPRVEYVNVEDLIFEPFTGRDGSKSIRIGRYRLMTIGDIMLQAGDQISNDDYIRLANENTGKNSNPYQFNLEKYEHHSFLIKVLDCQWFSVDTKKYLSGENRGNPIFKEVDFTAKTGKTEWKQGELTIKREVKEIATKTIYEGCWAVDTDIIWNFGKAKNITRSNENPKECSLKFKLYKIMEVSPCSSIEQYVDAIQQDWIKFRNAFAKAAPDGWDIDMGAMEDLLIGGKKIELADSLKMACETGVMVYKRNSYIDDDKGNTPNPITQRTGGIGTFAKELADSMVNSMNMIRETLGVNDAMDASNPNSGQLVGVQQLALKGSQNAIDHLLDAQTKITSIVAYNICLSLQLITKFKKVKGTLLTSSGYKLIELGNEINEQNGENIIYRARIESKPTGAEIQSIKEKINLALSNSQNPALGGIKISDAIEIERMINNGTNLKLVSLVLQNRINQSIIEIQRMTEANSKTQNDNILAQQEQAAKIEEERAKRKLDDEMTFYTHKTDEDIRLKKTAGSIDVIKDVNNSNLRQAENINTSNQTQ